MSFLKQRVKMFVFKKGSDILEMEVIMYPVLKLIALDLCERRQIWKMHNHW